MPTLDEIVQDAAKYPDSLEVPIGDGVKLSLGEIRRAVLAERKKQAELAAQQQELARASETLMKLYAEAEAAQNSSRQTQTAPAPATSDDPWSDPYLSPVRSRIEKLESQLAEVSEKKLKQIASALYKAIEQYNLDRWQSQFESLPERPQDLTLEQLIQKASTEKYLDQFERPDIRKAYDAIHGPKLQEKRLEEEREKARQQGREQALREMRERATLGGRPRAGSAQKLPEVPASLEDAGRMARNDNSLMEQLQEGLASLRMTQ